MSTDLQKFHPEICEFVQGKLADRVASKAAPHVVGASVAGGLLSLPGSTALIENMVRSALNFAATALGPAADALAVANREQIRLIIGQPVLEAVDKIVHDLEDVKQQAETGS